MAKILSISFADENPSKKWWRGKGWGFPAREMVTSPSRNLQTFIGRKKDKIKPQQKVINCVLANQRKGSAPRSWNRSSALWDRSCDVHLAGPPTILTRSINDSAGETSESGS